MEEEEGGQRLGMDEEGASFIVSLVFLKLYHVWLLDAFACSSLLAFVSVIMADSLITTQTNKKTQIIDSRLQTLVTTTAMSLI